MAVMQGANRLAQPHMHPVACSINPGLQSGFRGLSDGSAATVNQLLELHDSFLDRSPVALQGGAKASDIPRKKRKGSTHMDDTIAGRMSSWSVTLTDASARVALPHVSPHISDCQV